MRILILIITLLMIPAAGFSSGIASVNFRAIKPDLREYFLSKPENAELKGQFESAVKEEERFHEEIQRRISEGKSPIDIQDAVTMGRGSERFQLERRIDTDLKKMLYAIVSDMGLEYDLIYDASETGAILFAKRPVDDITTLVRQAIIDRGRAEETRQNKSP